jgi:hypothetical protein
VIAVAAVAILVELWWLLMVSWLSGAVGVCLGLAAFLDIPIRIGWLVKILT